MILKQHSVYFNQYVYQYRGRLRCKGTKTITASSRTPDFDRQYLPLEHWCLYNSSSIFENDLRYTNSQRLVVLLSLLVIAVCFLNSQRLVVCVCVSSYSFWTSCSLDVPAGVTQEEGHTLLHTLKCCCTLLENRVDVYFIAEPGSVNTSLYNNSTSNKSAFSAILPSRSPR